MNKELIVSNSKKIRIIKITKAQQWLLRAYSEKPVGIFSSLCTCKTLGKHTSRDRCLQWLKNSFVGIFNQAKRLGFTKHCGWTSCSCRIEKQHGGTLTRTGIRNQTYQN